MLLGNRECNAGKAKCYVGNDDAAWEVPNPTQQMASPTLEMPHAARESGMRRRKSEMLRWKRRMLHGMCRIQRSKWHFQRWKWQMLRSNRECDAGKANCVGNDDAAWHMPGFVRSNTKVCMYPAGLLRQKVAAQKKS